MVRVVAEGMTRERAIERARNVVAMFRREAADVRDCGECPYEEDFADHTDGAGDLCPVINPPLGRAFGDLVEFADAIEKLLAMVEK